jgi:hypothetical protein
MTAEPHPIAAVDTNTAGLLGVTDRGPLEAQIVTSLDDFTDRFGESITPPAPQVQSQWALDAAGGGEWWHVGHCVKGFFDNGGAHLVVKRVVADGEQPLRATDFVRALDAFERFDEISILLAPGIWAAEVQAALIARCEDRGTCFAVLDAPSGIDVPGVMAFREQRHSPFAALYYPWLNVDDPGTAQRISVPAAAHVAGVYARVDRARGVFKAPANEAIAGVASLAHDVTAAESEALVQQGINPLRALPGAIKVWAARTLSDAEWKYVNVRRLFIFIQTSIARSTQWVVFEPNGEQLWARVRRSIEDFLLGVWRTGGLAGIKPEHAFFVRCDRTTMSQDDIDQGRLVCMVGVAPLRPAEFVIVRIGQWTADRSGGDDDDRLSDPSHVTCESLDDCAPVRDAIGPGRQAGTLVLVSGGDSDSRAAAWYSLARSAALSFHRIDPSRVVSKYVGDTEKNLGRIFAAAEGADFLLFLDDADALLGRRAKARDAHDRYAALEVAYVLQRIEACAGVVVVATDARGDVPAAIRRFARCSVELPAIAQPVPPLPELSSTVDIEVVATHLHAAHALYFALMLEEVGALRAVERVAELFMQGLLPLGTSDAATWLSQYVNRAPSRSSHARRRELYARVFGMAGGDRGVATNREFDTLWTRFVSGVASWQPGGDSEALRKAGRDLALNLSTHGAGLPLYAANELAEDVRDAIAILSHADVLAAYGARDMWQVVERVLALDLGGARNTVRYRSLATAGAGIIAWLAMHLQRLAPSATGPVLEGSGSSSDAQLVTACENWLAARFA